MASQVTVAATNRVHRHELSIGCPIFDLQVRMTDAQTDELHAVWTMLSLWSLDSTLIMICHVTVTGHRPAKRSPRRPCYTATSGWPTTFATGTGRIFYWVNGAHFILIYLMDWRRLSLVTSQWLCGRHDLSAALFCRFYVLCCMVLSCLNQINGDNDDDNNLFDGTTDTNAGYFMVLHKRSRPGSCSTEP